MTTENTCTPTRMRQLLNEKYGGLLRRGSHSAADGQCCILELVSECRTGEFTDSPAKAGRPDIRLLNDGPWPDDLARTEAMLRLDEALLWWPDDEPRRQRFAQLLAIRTVNVLIADLPGLPGEMRQRCRDARTAHAAARWAAAVVMTRAVDLWIECAERSVQAQGSQ